MNEYDLVIVGAGAAGLFAAALLADSGLNTLILEKKSKLGIKVLISGAGQCNFSQDEERTEFVKHFYDKERFVKAAIFNLDTKSLVEYFDQLGLKSVVRDDGKIFPASLKSSDLVNVLYDEFRNKINLKRDTAVEAIDHDGQRYNLKLADELIFAKRVLLATGGFTYPSTGSAGDGYNFAKSLGHELVEPRRALSAFTLKNYNFASCAGISLKEVKLICQDKNSKDQVMVGDVLFTHKGISGPVVLHMSRYIKAGMKLKLALHSFENKEEFRTEFKSLCQQRRSQEIKTLLNVYLPKRLSLSLLSQLNIRAEAKVSQLNKKDLSKIFESLAGFEFEVAKLASLEQAMLSAGGVSTKEISAKTMQSKLHQGLYFAGELIDVDGESGGYNIHWAFASAALAVKDILKSR